MALETMKDVGSIGGYGVQNSTYYIAPTKTLPVSVDNHDNVIAFKIQNGPIKEGGVNGCQVDTLIHVAAKMIEKLNVKYPCEENSRAIEHLEGAIGALESRKKDREKRGVEGQSKA